MEFVGIDKFSLLDYEEKVSIVLFSPACNFRCPFCHNGDSVLNSNTPIAFKDIISYLKTRVGLVDAVVFTGGEPTMMPELEERIREVKKLGFLIKLDTNGTNPEVLKHLLDKKLLDYVAMDIKAPVEKYPLITGVQIEKDRIKNSIDLIMQSGVKYEFRTTVVKSQLSYDDFEKIGQFINGADKYFLQKFEANKIYDESLRNEKTYSNEEFDEICGILKKYVKFVKVR